MKVVINRESLGVLGYDRPRTSVIIQARQKKS
jgi:hypothetical protein